jgi:hypothetical protein
VIAVGYLIRHHFEHHLIGRKRVIASHPRRATAHTLITDTAGNCWQTQPHALAALEAAVAVRAGRRNRYQAFDAVHVYDTTYRTGAGPIVAYVHYQPGTFDGVADFADLYEIPTEALTNL